MDRNYYVYEHIRLDNMTCFYVGKGRGRRSNTLKRNKHHDRISKKYGHAVVIVADNLTENEAFELERNLIEEYVFEYGYGIDIYGYRNEEDDTYLTNSTFGGEGSSKGGTVSYECEVCGELTFKSKSAYEKADHHFCSLECHRKWQIENPPQNFDETISYNCEICGKECHVNKYRYEH